MNYLNYFNFVLFLESSYICEMLFYPVRCSWRHSSGNVLILTVLSTNQHHDVIVMWQITLELQEIYTSGDCSLHQCTFWAKDDAFQSMYYLHIISADTVRAVRMHIQMHGLSFILLRRIKSTEGGLAELHMCLSYLLRHTQTHTRSVYQAQSLIFCVLFFSHLLSLNASDPFTPLEAPLSLTTQRVSAGPSLRPCIYIQM